MHLPPLAYLRQILECLEEISRQLDRALNPAKTFKRLRGDADNDLKLAVALHALKALEGVRAIVLLGKAEQGNAISPHFRTLFDTLVKLRWMRRNPPSATNYLQAEPFERYVLATTRVRASDKWPKIVQDCEDEVTRNPSLLTLKDRKGRPVGKNLRKIARALRMPDMRTMALAVGMDEDDYLLDFAVPSFYPHASVTLTKNFAKGVNKDGTVTLSAEGDPSLLLGYVARAATRAGQILNEVLEIYPDGVIQHEAEATAKKLTELVSKLKSTMPETF